MMGVKDHTSLEFSFNIICQIYIWFPSQEEEAMFLFKNLHLFITGGGGVCVCMCISFTLWILGTELRTSDLIAGAFTN